MYLPSDCRGLTWRIFDAIFGSNHLVPIIWFESNCSNDYFAQKSRRVGLRAQIPEGEFIFTDGTVIGNLDSANGIWASMNGACSRCRDCYSAAPSCACAGVSLVMEGERQQNDSLVNG